MNNCTFVGRLVDDPALKSVNNTSVVNFTLAIEEYRRDQDGTKKKRVDFLDFEAWDSGATTIEALCSKGDSMVVNAVARQQKWTKDGKMKERIKFRVKNFKVFNRHGTKEQTPDG